LSEVENISAYRKNLMLKRAIERNLEIIGEAVNRIAKSDQNFLESLPEAMSIIGLRNQIIHAYDNISDEIIWSILIYHLPKLEKAIKLLLLRL
jgi:uncharacterized protein with HEPN domain